MENEVIVGSAIVGIINAIQMQFPQVKGLIGVGIALLLGVVVGWFHLFGLTIEQGILVALASSGVYKVASKMGGA